MKDVAFTWDKIIEASQSRPEGYLDDIRQYGTIHYANGEPSVVTLTADAYEALKLKYRPGYSSPPSALAKAPSPTSSGPGTELKALLKDWLGIQASPNCSCNARARQMDEWGPDLCEENLPTILQWLEEQAKARKLPFVRFAAEQAVKLAIRRARKKAAN